VYTYVPVARYSTFLVSQLNPATADSEHRGLYPGFRLYLLHTPSYSRDSSANVTPTANVSSNARHRLHNPRRLTKKICNINDRNNVNYYTMTLRRTTPAPTRRPMPIHRRHHERIWSRERKQFAV